MLGFKGKKGTIYFPRDAVTLDKTGTADTQTA